MAKPAKSDGGNSPAELRRRIERASTENRYQTALDLAKQLYKYESTPENRALLFQVHLGRAGQLREQGATRDVCTVLENATNYADNDPSRLLSIAEEMVACGELKRAMAILDRVPEPKPTAKLLGKGADAALRKGAQGRSLLPDSMQADFDRIRTAFSHHAAGQDEQVKEVLQGIGLASPFLEWKLLLRGLTAYHQNDDARALENWSRLDSTRFPARIAAPFRFLIDPSFQSAQSSEMQMALRKQADRLQGDTVQGGLRTIQSHFLKNQGLRAAFRDAEQLVPAMRENASHLIPKLANCFYWEVIHQGEPADMGRYAHVFGTPFDDKKFSRMMAMVNEAIPSYIDAHMHWQDYEKEIAANKTLWPGPENDRARAMIWYRLGTNAEKQDDVVHALEHMPFSPFGGPRSKPKRLEPSAEKCYRRAAELAPDWLEPAEALFEHFGEAEQPKKAIEAGRALLTRFPDHQATLEAMADLLRDQDDFAAATEMLERAMSANPLNRALRLHLGEMRRNLGWRFTVEGKTEKARETFQSVFALLDHQHLFPVYCQWAACEFQAGDVAKAEELVQKASTSTLMGSATSAFLFAMAVALKLPKNIKSRFEKEFKAQLDAPPTSAVATALAALFARFQLEKFVYHGGKTHIKKVTQLVEKTLSAKYTEDQMQVLGTALLVLGAARAIQRFAQRWHKEFPHSPYPLFFEMESYLKGNEERWPLWKLGPLAEKAKRLAEKMPPDDKRDRLIKTIDARLEQFRDLNPFASMFEAFAEQFGGGPDDEWDEEDDGW